jgi:hypothetical protein
MGSKRKQLSYASGGMATWTITPERAAIRASYSEKDQVAAMLPTSAVSLNAEVFNVLLR